LLWADFCICSASTVLKCSCRSCRDSICLQMAANSPWLRSNSSANLPKPSSDLEDVWLGRDLGFPFFSCGGSVRSFSRDLDLDLEESLSSCGWWMSGNLTLLMLMLILSAFFLG
jgi:hypothetical protein